MYFSEKKNCDSGKWWKKCRMCRILMKMEWECGIRTPLSDPLRCIGFMAFHATTLQYFAHIHFLVYTPTVVPLKGKLTVLTHNSILNLWSFWESRMEFRGSSFEFWFWKIESSLKFWVSTHWKNFLRISNRDFVKTI